MPAEPTNRELYLAVAAQGERHRGSPRTLEEYLRALWALATPLRGRPSLSGADLLRLLEEAWTAPVPPFDERWRERPQAEAGPGFPRWEKQILRQIRDLREMAEAGTLEKEDRYFGVDAPGGSRWYNFHPAGFLEAAVEGTFGGWRPGDEGRMLVPGPVAVLGPDGITSADPAELDRPEVPLGDIDWELFADFLYWGQSYE